MFIEQGVELRWNRDGCLILVGTKLVERFGVPTDFARKVGCLARVMAQRCHRWQSQRAR